MKVKEESEKIGLKLNIQKTKIMASGPITSWQVEGETVADFIILGSQITAEQIAVKRREVKSKGEKERYKHLNAEFQRKQEEITKPSSAINEKK